jgi:penicillin-binding protein 1A
MKMNFFKKLGLDKLKLNKRARVIVFASSVFLILVLVILKTYSVYKKDLPSLAQLHNIQPKLITKVYSSEGELIQEFFTERRLYVPLKDTPDEFVDALLAVEDRKFYDHWGVNSFAILRAFWANLTHFRIVQGASTITQQLSRSLFLTPEKTIARKIKEALTAIKIERTYSKDEILEMYINQCYFGKGAYGIKAAAEIYFNKEIKDLTISDCALLVGLLKSPGRYSPTRDSLLALSRRNLVLNSMWDFKKEDYSSLYNLDSLKRSPLELDMIPQAPAKAPYFTEKIRRYLMRKFGEDTLYTEGLSVYTTLRLDLQQYAESLLYAQIDYWQNIIESSHTLEDTQYTITYPDTVEGSTDTLTGYKKLQGALVALDNRTGDILAMVGGRNFEESEWNRAVQATRQPGSAFKLFVFTAAIDNGYKPTDIIYDTPIILIGDDGKEWSPENFDKIFRGPVTLREGLMHSINLVSAKLTQRVSPHQVAFYADKLGLKTHINPVPSLALGTSEVTLLQLTDAYSVFPNQGIRVEPRFITSVTDRFGNILEENTTRKEEVLSAQTAYVMTTMLQSVVDNGTGFGARKRGFSRPAGGKTGTTDMCTDNWFIGFTPQITVGVWIGFDDKTPIGDNITGAHTALPVWADFMIAAHQDLPVEEFDIPEGIHFKTICLESGELATDKCHKVITDVFTEKTLPQKYCHLHPGEPLPTSLDEIKFQVVEKKPAKKQRLHF